MALQESHGLLQRASAQLCEAKNAAGEWITRSLIPNPPFLMYTCGFNHDSCVMDDLEDDFQALHEGGLHLLRGKESVPRQCARGI